MCKNDYSWNPNTCIYENGKYLKSNVDDSVMVCDNIINARDHVRINKPDKYYSNKCGKFCINKCDKYYTNKCHTNYINKCYKYCVNKFAEQKSKR